MEIMEKQELYARVLKAWGLDTQLGKLLEEMAELELALLRYPQGRADLDDIAEEFADTLIMCEQIVLALGLDADVRGWADCKLVRLEQRLNAYEYSKSLRETPDGTETGAREESES